ncbi:hypothetical protein FACS189487_05710 [Campylobacterota bacterium]|nr:hypothetical protein FACS189487_05710 [Campylobacterota bacterium]
MIKHDPLCGKCGLGDYAPIRRIKCPKCGRKIVMMSEAMFVSLGGRRGEEIAEMSEKEQARLEQQEAKNDR